MFDSKAKKAEKDYNYLTTILRSSNIDTVEKVEEHIQKATSKALYASVIMFAAIGLLCLVSPKYYPIWGITGVMCFAWIWKSAFTAKSIMRRYIDEEINNANRTDKEDN